MQDPEEVTRLKAQLREQLTSSPLPDDDAFLPKVLFPYVGRTRTYWLLKLGVIPAKQLYHRGAYLINRQAFLNWVYADSAIA